MATARPVFGSMAQGVLLAAWLAASLTASSAGAQPSVRIQAGTQLELEGIEQGSARGRLLDDRGQPLADRVVIVEAKTPGGPRGERVAARTGRDGRFQVQVAGADGEVELAASYAGDRLVAPTRAEGRFDTSLAPVRLLLLSPELGRVDLDQAHFELRVVADSRAGGAGLELTVQDESGRVLTSGVTDAKGRFERALPAALLDPPGPHLVAVRSAEDGQHSAAHVEQRLVAYLRTALTLDADHATERDSERVALQGRLSTARGPLARKAVGLFIDGAHLATLVTDEAGRFRHLAARPPSGVDAPREAHVQARFDSDGAWLASSRSPSLTLRWAASAGPSPWWLLAPSVACMLLVLAWTRRRSEGERSSVAPRTRGPGIHALGTRSRGRPSRDLIAGVVLDARSEQPIAGASVALEGPGGARHVMHTTGSGRFELLALEPGAWRMTVTAEGFASQSQPVGIPHHGAWADVQVSLSSLRWVALEAFRPAAEHVLPSPNLWGQWTLGEIRDSAKRSGRGGQPLEQATQLTERTAYGPETPQRKQIDDIERAAAEVVHHHAPPRAPSGDSSG